jgi:GDPmannose 4,6-dehydratase
MPNALITGITGQDGSYLAELLLDKGYQVFGMVRRASTFNDSRIKHLLDRITLIDADLLDQLSLIQALNQSQATEVYNLAAMSFVATSFQQPVATGEYTALSVARVLEAIRLAGKPIRFYQASTSEMFGKVQTVPQHEQTPFYPRSPYGVAKLYGHWMTTNFRESYDMYACSGILFNHESPRRGVEFVTRKITIAVARIALGLPDRLTLGNLDAERDWGFAGDYVEAMWLMLQQERPVDYVIATGQTHSVREFVQAAFAVVGITDWERYVETNPQYLRPAEVDQLIGDASKAQRELGWTPRVTFDELVKMMVESDLEQITRDHGKTRNGQEAESALPVTTHGARL